MQWIYRYLSGTCYKFWETWEHIFGSLDRDENHGRLNFHEESSAQTADCCFYEALKNFKAILSRCFIQPVYIIQYAGPSRRAV